MDEAWLSEFRQRLTDFQAERGDGSSTAVSIKVRVSSGCFHREHSPEAYQIIDRYLAAHPLDPVREEYIEHESGPEVIAYIALGAAGLGLAKSIIELITAIIKARSEGIKKGDKPREALAVIVRGYRNETEYFQETTLRIENQTAVDSKAVKQALDGAFKTLTKPNKAQGKPGVPGAAADRPRD
jgi:hypothetical protein